MNSNITLQVAVKAIIFNDLGQVLILRESSKISNSQTGKYGLPGGRVNVGENYLDALRREVKEETNLIITIGNIVYSGEWRPVIKGTQHQIIGMFFICKIKNGKVRISAEHNDYKWILKDEIDEYNIMQPDDKALENAFKN